MHQEIKSALNTLKNGGIILYPTDTIWGIGCDATNTEAIKKIFKLKKRADSKALISLVANKTQLEQLVPNIPEIDITTTPTTIIYPKAKGLAKNITAENGSAAIRIVQDIFCKELITQFGKPIVSTSANISGNKYPQRFSEISEEISENVDYIVNLHQDEIMSTPSTIILINEDGNIKKIR